MSERGLDAYSTSMCDLSYQACVQVRAELKAARDDRALARANLTLCESHAEQMRTAWDRTAVELAKV